MTRSSRVRPLLRTAKALASPVRARPTLSMRAYPRFWREWRQYRALGGEADFLHLRPQLADATASHQVDHHYVQQGAWAMRKLVDARPPGHVDVGGQTAFVAMASAVTPVEFVDIRALGAEVPNVSDRRGTLLDLPYLDRSVRSISCLHVAEHVGLGRYGDPLDPSGTEKSASELQRVLAPLGDLYFGLPVGVARTEFNAHRVHDPVTVPTLFPELDVVEFAVVADDGSFHASADPRDWRDQSYACGLFHLRRADG